MDWALGANQGFVGQKMSKYLIFPHFEMVSLVART